MSPIGSFYGNSGCAQVSGVGSFVYARAVPFNAGGIANTTGTWVFSMDTAGCFAIDQGPPTTTTSFVTQSLSTLLAASIPGSILSVNQSVQMRAIGLVNESCVASEVTEASFAVTYIGTTVVNSLVINLRTAGNSGVGADAPFTLYATFDRLTTPTSTVRVTLEYRGAFAGGTQVTTQLYSTPLSVNVLVPQSMSFTVDIHHTDTTAAVHSHGCHSVVLDHAEFEILGNVQGT
jgi:hypothetical protein